MSAPILIQSHRRRARHRRGAMLVLIAIMMLGFMVAVAFSVDVAMMHLSRTELRTATDAATKAAAATLADSVNVDQAITRGQQIAAANTVNGQALLLARSDFQFGRSQQLSSGRFEFSPDSIPRNSVRVDGRRTFGSLSGPVPLFFGNILGVEYFEPQTQATATYIERDIALVVDRSGSMTGTKFLDLTAAIDIFVSTLDETPVDERVGLASYSEFATADVSLTSDLSQISSGVRALRLGGFTSISRGMEAGRTVMNSSRSPEFVERTMIVMTDGLHNRGPEPRTTAISLAADGVKIHTITFGRDADRRRMEEVALIGGGRHYHADNGTQLREIYREIALTLSTMITE
jgi:Ca-activated chloride channel family protein